MILNHFNFTQKHKEASKLKANVALINKEKAVVRQKWGREKWITYVGAFMQHRNLMIGVWNNLVKRNEDWDTEQEIQEMFNIEGIRRIPIDGTYRHTYTCIHTYIHTCIQRLPGVTSFAILLQGKILGNLDMIGVKKMQRGRY